ncbi:MAG: hypothetical protein AB7O26_16540 [Planctomycetaceae bacterium]
MTGWDDRSRWVDSGRGISPEVTWSFVADAPLVWFDLAAESGEVAVADESGGIYLISRSGQVAVLTRGLQALEQIVWSDCGNGGAGVVERNRLCRINRQMKTDWTLDFPEAISCIDISPFGNHIVVALVNGENRVIDWNRKVVAKFHTLRPLKYLEFLANSAEFVGAAEYGLLCRYRINGTAAWSEALWSNVGSLATTGDGETIFLAAFSYGLQRFDGQGENRGAYVVEGSPSLVATTWTLKRIAVSTIERHLYWLDGDGELLWANIAPEDIAGIYCDPLGKGIVCGLRSGQVLNLNWGFPEGE